MRRITTFALLTTILLAYSTIPVVRAEQATVSSVALQDLNAKDLKKLLEILPKFLWSKSEVESRKAREEWSKRGFGKAALDKKQFEQLAAVLRNGSPYTTEKKKELRFDVKTGENGENGKEELMPVVLAAPPRYKPGCGKSFGLIISMHGGPALSVAEAKQHSSTQFGIWNSVGGSVDCMVAAPAITGSNWGEREWRILQGIMAEAERNYNLDCNRILLTGHSWGGILTWQVGPQFADKFAGLAPFVCAVNPGIEALRNCRALPIYSVQGENDAPFIVKDGRERIDILKNLGYDYIFREKKGGHEIFSDEVTNISKWFEKHPRNIYAPEIVRTPSKANKSDLWYWLRTDKPRYRATVKDNQVELDFFSAGTEVFLADEMLDLDKPVRIICNGEEVFSGAVQRSVAFAVAHALSSADRGRIFANSIRLK